MKLTWYGHATFRLETDQATILIDPFLSGNPHVSDAMQQAASEGVTHIALTHGHGDHVGDTLEIAEATGATVLANYDLIQWLQHQGLQNVDPGNTGGTLHHDGFSVTFVQAFHSSATIDENGIAHSLGMPNGLVFHFQDGPSVYHMGDTDIFGDMALIEELHQPQVGLVPVGDRFTMGGAVAALACQRYFKFKTIIPCHFGTFPIIDATADAFVTAMGETEAVKLAELGVAIEI